MTPKDVERFFTFRRQLLFARWGRPIAPIAFGIEDQSIATLKGAIEVTCAMVGHPIAETDPELGTNLMFFFIRDWDELLAFLIWIALCQICLIWLGVAGGRVTAISFLPF